VRACAPLVLALCGLVASGQAVAQHGASWREVATPHDRERLRGWRSAWMEGLAAARAGGGAEVISADPALFDPDRSRDGALPPPGAYRCRVVKLGVAAAHGFFRSGWGQCRVEAEGALLRLSRTDGMQRPTGLIFADGNGRAIFLGTMVLSDERRALGYGVDDARDLIGLVERIGEARWRVALPYPRFQSTLDVVELVPAAT